MARSSSTGCGGRVTISTLVDTNIFIDVLGNGPFMLHSTRVLRQSMADGPIILSAIVWSELSPWSDKADEIDRRIAWMRPERQDFPFGGPFYLVGTKTASGNGSFSLKVGPLWAMARLHVTTRTTIVAASGT